MEWIEDFRKYRSKKLEKIAAAAVRIGLKANYVTTLSLLSGIAALYFLFSNYYLFALFIALHLICDGFDGVVARASKATVQGKYFDLLADSSITVLALVKTAWYLQELYAYVAAGLFLLVLVIHLKFRLQTPMIFMRTASVIVLLVAAHPLFPFSKALLTAGYLAAGGTSLYSLARQLQWRMKHGPSK